MVTFSFGGGGRKDGCNKPLSICGKAVGSLFFLGFFGIGTVFEVLVIGEFAKNVGERFWEKTLCAVLAAGIEEKPGSNQPYSFTVRYSYEYDSQKYSSTVYKRGYKGSDRYHKARSLAEKYPPGKETVCYVNPGEPSRAVLKRGSLLFGLAAFFPLISVFIGAGGIYAVWFCQGGKAKTEPIASGALRRGKKGKYGAAIFFSMCALAGAGMLYPLTIRPVAKTLEAKTWAETPCRILSAQVRSHSSDDGTTYGIDIFYQYEFDGKTYKSDRYSFVGGSSSGHKGKARVVESYKKARNPVCYVNPKDPSEAVLKRGFHLGLLVGFIPILFVAVGLAGLAHAIRGRKRRLQSASAGGMSPGAKVGGETVSADRSEP